MVKPIDISVSSSFQDPRRDYFSSYLEKLRYCEKNGTIEYFNDYQKRYDLFAEAILELIDNKRNTEAIELFFEMEETIFFKLPMDSNKELFFDLIQERKELEKIIHQIDRNVFYYRLEVIQQRGQGLRVC